MSNTNYTKEEEQQQASSSSPLPPISSLPNGIYPPSTYPPPSYFQSSTTLKQPALIIPAKRTGEIIKLLSSGTDTNDDNIVYSEKKCKRVYGVEVGTDYDESDLNKQDGKEGYNPKNERKLVLKSLGTTGLISNNCNGNPQQEIDQVYYDKHIIQLMQEIEEKEVDTPATTSTTSSAPPGRISIRPSYINLPSNLSYNVLTVDQVLTRILPSNQNINEIPSSFEIAGHIAHVNLRSETLPYKYLIGKAILDKNCKTIKVVVNKIGNIENEYRTFPMEIIAGSGLDVDEVEKICNTPPSDGSNNEVQIKVESPKHDKLMIVQVKEHGCKFTLDFANVYFNSRLQSEHNRLVQYIVNDASRKKKKECTIVADAMAGVGPFAIPLTSSSAQHCQSSKIICHANDLNPISYKYLLQNGQTNKCQKDRLYTYNLDGREFIHKMNEDGIKVDHYIMNLPQMAPEFLNAFRGYKFHRGDEEDRPMVHVHCFGEKPRLPQDVTRIEREVQERCETALGCPNCFLNWKNDVNIRIVRDVGPRKNMLCVSFLLPLDVGNVDKIVLAKSGDKRERSGEDAREDTKRSKE